jgi:superfamily II DNA/RNA helicase
LHGNLAQNARERNLSAFAGGTAQTLVATDIAARGIHVDDVALVIHADPPVEHKAYLHRSGRTARAGASGTVITLMTDDQQRDVRDLTRKAGIRPITTAARPGDPVLSKLAPGERKLTPPAAVSAGAASGSRPAGRSGPGHRDGESHRSGPASAHGRRTRGRRTPSRSTGAPSGIAAFSAASRAGGRRGR